ncbi:hypothetical protein KSU1_D0750 [Candidatus Jettenia caeni]|uniref:Uncharacterized protein n=2 Tax=Candidatus Jettenia TaxID=360731 RepID=I3IQR4_9BACT|nr:hypothetical protein KSU1_D0750 [Candidatus Jettenia caeni]
MVKGDLKKLDKGVVKEIYDIHLENILHEPYRGEKLHGDLEGVLSYHFRLNSSGLWDLIKGWTLAMALHFKIRKVVIILILPVLSIPSVSYPFIKFTQ